MKEIIKNQNEISKGNKNKKEIEIDNKLNEISKILNEISNGKKDNNVKEDNKIKEEKIVLNYLIIIILGKSEIKMIIILQI